MEKLNLNTKMKDGLKLLLQNGRVLITNQPFGISSSTAHALERRGLAEIKAESGRPDRNRGVNRGEKYVSVTEKGRIEAKYL
jgi:hypothetical protein